MHWDLGAQDPRFLYTLGAFHAGISILTFLAYAFDKRSAIKGRGRIPENTLHILSLLGGWPGALAAQKLVRHKTRKQPFRLIFWITLLSNLVVLVWLMSENGQQALSDLLYFARQ
ncbi:MAG: DUF1294 domain-containing protein [Alphaproteobacteria bacterium]|nr:DUF1294 domain-containing protein [Alphaproteobacteria bacterium]